MAAALALLRRRARRWALNGAAAVALAYILPPLIFVVWLAFFRQEIPSFPPEGYSLRWFAAILDQRKFVDGFSLSFQVGVLATLIGLALGVPAALCLVRFQFGCAAPLASLLLMPLIVPGVVLGTAMYVFHVELENGLDVDVHRHLLRAGGGPRRDRHSLGGAAGHGEPGRRRSQPPRKPRKISAPTPGSPSGASPCRRSGRASWPAPCSASSPRSAISR